VRVCVILIGEGPVPLLARKSALSMPSMGKRMGLANPQDGRDDVTEGIHGRAARVERAASECSRA
jgi:hypothetical protein